MVIPSTPLEKILKLVDEQQMVNMLKWSERSTSGISQKNHYLIKLIKKIRSLLVLISGDDLVPMLKDLLSKTEIDSLCEPYKEALIGLVNIF